MFLSNGHFRTLDFDRIKTVGVSADFGELVAVGDEVCDDLVSYKSNFLLRFYELLSWGAKGVIDLVVWAGSLTISSN